MDSGQTSGHPWVRSGRKLSRVLSVMLEMFYYLDFGGGGGGVCVCVCKNSSLDFYSM